MIPVLIKEDAYKLDKETIVSGHLSQEKLMDNAGKAIAQFFCEKIKDPFNKKVVVVCGKGNNGGDGVIAHSYLAKYNISSKIVFTEEKHYHSNKIKKYKISKNEYSIYNDKTNFNKYDWIIDAIFGIGFSRELNEKDQKLITELNYLNNIISIDIPSGFYADSDKSKCFIHSKYVITFGYPKLGHYLLSLNKLHISDIGFKQVCSDIKKIENVDILKIVKPFKKNKNIHKYSKARCYIVAGSDDYPGAAILSAMAAAKTGSSYVNLLIDSKDNSLISKIDISLPDIIVKKTVSTLDFVEIIKRNIPVLIGPGNLERYHFKNIDLVKDNSLIIDAGAIPKGINLEDYSDNTIFTPHLQEFKRMFNLEDNFIIDYSLFESIQKKIERKIIILKSFNIFIMTNDKIYIMDRGPSLLATAGTGDVLSGILVSLLSQGYSRLEASIFGTYLHAEAANYYMNNISKDGMTASDLIDCIPYAFNKLRKND
tara:strand:+ start:1599 stop:3047 length:1449 start_codon:yes stop_codon:yes gene_type:complete